MNKEIQVLYVIFELELAPPFKLAEDPTHPEKPDIVNKHLEPIGWLSDNIQRVVIDADILRSILNKIKRTFNIDELLDDDVYHIAKHLVDWLQDKLPVEINVLSIWNNDTEKNISYKKDKNNKS